MREVIDKNLEENITTGLKFNHVTAGPTNVYKLPKFVQNEKGEYVFVGNANISTLKEFRQYKKAYGEIAKNLSNYKKTVGQIYKNALNSLIADNTKYLIDEGNKYSLSTKLSNVEFTANTVREDTSSNYGRTLSYITKAAYKTKRLKPSAEINNLIKNASNSSSRICVLPVMTDNGVVLNQGKNNKATIEASFKTISYSGANEIKQYLIAATNNLPESVSNQIKSQIEDLFKESRKIGELVESGFNTDLATKLENLAVNFSDLIGVDLTHYDRNSSLKTNKKAKLEPVQTETTNEFDYSLSSQEAEHKPEPKKTLETTEILLDGSYKTSPAVEDGRIVTKLTPDGLKFVVQLKNNKLLVKNIEQEQSFNDFESFSK